MLRCSNIKPGDAEKYVSYRFDCLFELVLCNSVFVSLNCDLLYNEWTNEM